MNPRVAVAIANYNNASYLQEALESVLSQTYTEYEVVIVDDASSDESDAILKSYTDKYANIRVYKNDTNKGIAATRNRILEYVSDSVEYIALLDSDDVLESTRFAEQVAYLDMHTDVAVVGSWFAYITQDGTYIKDHPYNERWCGTDSRVLYTPTTAQTCAMVRRNIYEKVGTYNENLKGGEDYDFWLRVLLHGYCIANIQKVLTRYRIHEAQGTMAHSRHQYHGFRVRWKYLWKGFFSIPGFLTTLGFGIVAILPKRIRNYFRVVFITLRQS